MLSATEHEVLESIADVKSFVFKSKEYGYMDIIGWYFSSLGYLLASNDLFIIDNDKMFMKNPKGGIHPISFFKQGSAIIKINDKINITNSEVPYLKENEVTVTFGNFLLNYLYIEKGIRGLIDYIPRKISLETVEKAIIKNLLPDPSDPSQKDPSKIYISDLMHFSKMVLGVKELEPVISITSSDALKIPTKGLKEFKEKRYNYYVAKYGDKFFETAEYMIGFQEDVRKYDIENHGDDLALAMGSFKQLAREKNLYYAGRYGNMDMLDPVFVLKPLSEGHSLEREHIVAMANDILEGSMGRGSDTKESGVLSKILIMIGLGLVIKEKDCGTIIGDTFVVSDDNYKKLIKGYYINPKSPKIKFNVPDEKEAKVLIGKTVTLMSLHYCKTRDGYCEMCCGDEMSKNHYGFVLSFVNNGGKLLNANMKKMHGTLLELIDLNIEEELL